MPVYELSCYPGRSSASEGNEQNQPQENLQRPQVRRARKTSHFQIQRNLSSDRDRRRTASGQCAGVFSGEKVAKRPEGQNRIHEGRLDDWRYEANLRD